MNSGNREEKRALRNEFRKRLDELTASEKADAATLVRSRLVQIDQYCDAEVVGIYSAIEWEIDLIPLLNGGRESGKRFAFPRWCAESNQYEFVGVEASYQLVRGRYGILEPEGSCQRLDRGRLDFVVIPGLAFSQNGARLGRGRGFYDRLLENCRALLCGVCYDFQLLDELPQDPWDKVMNRLVTPMQCVRTSEG